MLYIPAEQPASNTTDLPDQQSVRLSKIPCAGLQHEAWTQDDRIANVSLHALPVARFQVWTVIEHERCRMCDKRRIAGMQCSARPYWELKRSLGSVPSDRLTLAAARVMTTAPAPRKRNGEHAAPTACVANVCLSTVCKNCDAVILMSL